MQFIKKYNKLSRKNNTLIYMVHYIPTYTTEQYNNLKQYELKKYDFNVKHATYTFSKTYKKKNHELVINKYPEIAPHYEKKIKNIKLDIFVEMPFLFESLIECKLWANNQQFVLSTLVIIFDIKLNTNNLIPFSSKSHTKKCIYRIDTALCTICIYNDYLECINATGITSIKNAIKLCNNIKKLQ